MTVGSIRVVVVVIAMLASLTSAAPKPTTRPAGFKYVSVTTLLDENGLPKKLQRKEIYFIGDGAFVVDAEGVADMHMDLRRQIASDEQGARWSMIDLQQRIDQERTAAQQRAEKTKEADVAERLKYEIEPAFSYTEENGKLIASNPFVRYEMDCVPIDPAFVKRLFLATRLITLTSASPTSPPYTTLALSDELERRGCIIQEGKIITKVGPDKQTETRIQSRLTPLTDDDQKRLATLLLPAGGL
jgi:hypothetical protein